MSIPSIHASLRSQASQQNAPATNFTQGQLRFTPAVRVSISPTGAAIAKTIHTASNALEETVAAGRLAAGPYESSVTGRRGAAAYEAAAKS